MKLMMSGGEDASLFHKENPVFQIQIEKLVKHLFQFGIADYGCFRVTQKNFHQSCGMIRLHVMDDHIIQFRSPARALRFPGKFGHALSTVSKRTVLSSISR